MKSKLSKFHSVTIKKGYKHSELREMLADVHLGIIPVLWEDNLPQIAIEMVAMGVPVLCSSFGGASELCNSKLFKFDGGNAMELKERILYFLNNREALGEYYKNHCGLVTMKNHWDELSEIIAIPKCKVVTYSFDEIIDIIKFNSFHNLNNESKGVTDSSINNISILGIGRSITLTKALLKKTIHCYRDNGFVYTLNKVLSKL